MGLASHPNQIPQRVDVPGGVGIIDTIEMTETLRIAHAPGVVVVLDAFPSNDPQFFVGREIQILYPDGRVRTVTVDAVRDHGVTISFFFRGWTRTDVPAGSRIEFG